MFSRKLLVRGSALVLGAGAGTLGYLSYLPEPDHVRAARSSFPLPPALSSELALSPADPIGPEAFWAPPSRADMIQRVRGSEAEAAERKEGEVFDLVVVGGGATGAGVALDATTRGLRVALFERDDFAAGTSSKSTKLVHGGVRYLEKAVWNLDMGQYTLVKEALHERGVFLRMAPHLTYQLPTLLPIYQLWKVPYFWAGTKAYDALAAVTGEALNQSYVLSAREALERFPTLKREGLRAGLVYFDGAQNDSRMAVSLLLTAVGYGAVALNQTEVVGFLKEPSAVEGEEDQIRGVRVRDRLSGEEYEVRARGVVNAAGPFIDGVRSLDAGAEVPPMVSPSSGIHLTLPAYFTPKNMGLIDPATSDGRVLFVLPWQGRTILGTTDSPCGLSQNPEPDAETVRWLLREAEGYFSPELKVRPKDVLAAWAGIRPLVKDPSATSTQALVRSHLVTTAGSGLVTISGGKWTTFREMAQETVDTAVARFGLAPERGCVTTRLRVLGSANWTPNLALRLQQTWGLEAEVAEHLARSYGDRAWKVLAYRENRPLAPGFPILESEVLYAAENELAVRAADVLARRTRLSFLDARAAAEALPRVVELMGDRLGWGGERRSEEIAIGEEFLVGMGSRVLAQFDAEFAAAAQQ